MDFKRDVFRDGTIFLPCFWCGLSLAMRDATTDHIKPVSRGGKTTRENVEVSCCPCNERRAVVSKLVGRIREAKQNRNRVPTGNRMLLLSKAIKERDAMLDELLDLERLYYNRLSGLRLRWCLGELDELLRARL